MSTYRNTSRNRHSDERVANLGPIAKAVWDYVTCNQQDHACGLYRLSIAAACEDTGWTPKEFEDALCELEFERLIERDRKLRLVWVRNMLRRSYPRMMPKQRQSVETYLRAMPRTPLVGRLVAYYAERWGVELDVSSADDPTPNKGPAAVDVGPPQQSEEERGGALSESASVSESVSESASGSARARDPVPTREQTAADRTAAVERVRERLTLTGEVPQPRVGGQSLGNLPVRPDDVGKLLEAGITPDEVVATAAWLSGEVTAERALRGIWSSAFFGRWHDSLRQREIPEKFRPKRERGPVDPRTQRHDAPKEF